MSGFGADNIRPTVQEQLAASKELQRHLGEAVEMLKSGRWPEQSKLDELKAAAVKFDRLLPNVEDVPRGG